MIAGDFTGKIVEGVREGKGTLKWSNGDEYIGVFKNGLRHGKGVFREKNGRSYEGQWLISQKEDSRDAKPGLLDALDASSSRGK